MHSQAAPACFSIRIEALSRTEVLLTAATLLALWQCLFGRNRLVRYVYIVENGIERSGVERRACGYRNLV